MIEQEWLTSSNPIQMLDLIANNETRGSFWSVSDRKLRLFVCACARASSLWDNKCHRKAFEEVEQSDGMRGVDRLSNDAVKLARVWAEGYGSFYEIDDYCRLGSSILRDIVGNPFNRASVYSWHRNLKPFNVTGLLDFRREWVSKDVLAIANTIYNDKDWYLMTILADALTDANCNESIFLDHLRSSGPHYKGCWVLDLVLGKE